MNPFDHYELRYMFNLVKEDKKNHQFAHGSVPTWYFNLVEKLKKIEESDY